MMPWEEYGGKAEQPAPAGDGPWAEYATAAAPAPVVKPEVSSAEPKPVATRSTRDELIRQLGLTGRIMATFPVGVGSALADAGVGVANMLGANIKQKPSDAYQKFLTQLGLPEPETPLEQGVQVVGNMMGSVMDPTLTGLTKMFAGTPRPEGGFVMKGAPQETVEMAGKVEPVVRPNSYYKLHPNVRRPSVSASKQVSSEAPRAVEAVDDGFKINAWDVAHFAGNVAAQRYGAAAGNIAHMGAREWLHGHVPKLPGFDPLTASKMRLGLVEQADLDQFLFDPYIAQEQRKRQ